jgi:hypothetical protein
MVEQAGRDRLAANRHPAPAAHAAAPEWEKQRLRFELELLESQDAGAALDPLLRQARRENRSGQSTDPGP